MLYERLESCVAQKNQQQEIENIINALNIRTGSFGVERKNLINSLFKNIIQVSFPNFVKFLFWGSSNNKGIFEDIASSSSQMQDASLDSEKKKKHKLSKYQIEEQKSKGGDAE